MSSLPARRVSYLSASEADCQVMSRTAVLTDELWARIEPVLPPLKGGPAVTGAWSPSADLGQNGVSPAATVP